MVVGEVENGELRIKRKEKKKWLHYSSNDSAAIFLFYILAKQLHVRISTLNSQLILVPLNVTLRLASLLILQVWKNACICPDSNIIISPPSER